MNVVRNNVQIVGNITTIKPLEKISETKQKIEFSLCCVEEERSETGKATKKKTTFTCIANDGLASVVEKYTYRGKQVAVSGKLRSDGKNNAMVIVLTDILLLGSRKKTD